ncbi:MAG: hypothetical protein DLM73_04060 [Chthoniobacterales bacterium]|nr:MAG: hypothetical protein DLM73_04060 [Chthoniobacterales bacterium]
MKLIHFNPQWSIDAAAPIVTKAASVEVDSRIPVVIAEDDPVSRKIVDTVITRAGFRTIVTKDGEEAMAALRAEHGPCVAVLDWMMPGIDGPAICQRIRDGARPVYIIMLTARSAKEDAVAGLDVGADDYLVKPFDQGELLARIRVGMRALDRQLRIDSHVAELERTAREEKWGRMQVPL